MGLLSWILFGALVGWLSSLILGTDKSQGWIANIVLGVVGAIVGGALYSAIADDSFSFSWSIGSLIVALIGGVIVSWGYAALTRGR
ncbi:MAG: GlsB/YeaQ/YmgE family stress response membrane protein [Thermomicrobiales bacterium]|nr:GlsB/YeaQ/YmgE family stress response membrane protein [Thermomicrobiales bacterium]